MKKPVLVIGAGGHAKVLIDLLLLRGERVIGLVDADTAKHGGQVLGIPVLGGDEQLAAYGPEDVVLVNAIGSVGPPIVRKRAFEKYAGLGYRFLTVIHPSAVVAANVQCGEGAQVMAGAVVQAGTRIGADSIINTRASVDHDCRIGDHTHIAPGVTLSGSVQVGNISHLGTAATVIQGITIGDSCLVAAGALVIKDCPPHSTVKGFPASIQPDR